MLTYSESNFLRLYPLYWALRESRTRFDMKIKKCKIPLTLELILYYIFIYSFRLQSFAPESFIRVIIH